MTPKIFQKGGYFIEEVQAWGETPNWITPTGLPYITLGGLPSYNLKDNEEIIGRAYEGVPKLTGKEGDFPMSIYARRNRHDYWWYWMMGIENEPTEVVKLEAISDLSLTVDTSYRFAAIATGVTKATINAAGTGYLVEDVLSLVGTPGGSGATITVTAVAPVTGAITEFYLSATGSLYTTGTTATTTGGTGSNCTVDIEVCPASKLLMQYTKMNTDSTLTYCYLFADTAKDLLNSEGSIYTTAGVLKGLYTAYKDSKFLHLYETDMAYRHMRDFTTDEQSLTGYASGKKRNLKVSFLKAMTEYISWYKNSVCRSWSVSSKAGEPVKITTNFICKDVENVNNASVIDLPSEWDFTSDDTEIRNVWMHHNLRLELYNKDASTTVTLCLSEAEISCEMPLKKEQTSCSDIFVTEPLLEGTYKFTLKAKIYKHDTKAYQDALEAQTPFKARIYFAVGDDLLCFNMKEINFRAAGADDGTIASEMLEARINYNPDDLTPYAVPGVTELNDSPLTVVTLTDESDNSMFLSEVP